MTQQSVKRTEENESGAAPGALHATYDFASGIPMDKLALTLCLGGVLLCRH